MGGYSIDCLIDIQLVMLQWINKPAIVYQWQSGMTDSQKAHTQIPKPMMTFNFGMTSLIGF